MEDNMDALLDMAYEMHTEEENQDSEEPNACTHTNTYDDESTGSSVCMDCGVVVGDIICNKEDWSSYTQGVDNSRCGYTSDTFRLMPFQNNMTAISVNRWSPYMHKKMQRWNYSLSSKENSRERSYLEVFNKIDNICNTHSIVDCIGYTTKAIYIEMASKHLKRGNVRVALIASCMYYAFQIHGIYHTIEDMKEYFNVQVKLILSTNKLVSMHIWNSPSLSNMKNSINNKGDFQSSNITRYARSLGFEKKHEIQAERIFEKLMNENEYIQNKDMTYAFALSLYTVNMRNDLSISKDNICSECNMSVVTLNKLIQNVKVP